MEESDEPEQPISLGRQEFRRRRRPSQPMVDKSQQTDVTEKKKPVAVVQPPAPKATLSIDNISGSKDNYSSKEYESLRLSSQLQQTWVKRKRGMEMNDKSLQTEVPVEEKVQVIFTDKALTLEENPADIGEIAPELPQSVPGVEIPTSRLTNQLIDRSQQTSCTGDWSLLNICPKDKVDKEQQTYFSELEITIMSMPSSSLIKSKEETIPVAQDGPLFEVNGCLEIEVLSTEQVSDAMMPFTAGEFSGKIQALPADELASVEEPGDTSHLSMQEAIVYEPGDQQPPQGAEVDASKISPEILVSQEVLVKVQNLATEALLETSGKGETATAEESTDKVHPPPSEEASEEAHVEVQLPLNKQAVEAVSAEIVNVLEEEFPIEEVFEGPQPALAEEVSADKTTVDVQPAPAEDTPVAPSEETLEEVQSLPMKDGPIEILLSPAEDVLEDDSIPPTLRASEEVLSQPAEETPAEVSPPPSEEAPAEISSPPAEEAPAEISPPPAEEAPAEVSSPSAEEAPTEISPPPSEEAPGEISSTPAEEAPAEISPPPAEEAPAEISSPPAEEAPAEISPPPAEEAPAEVSSPSAEEAPTEISPPPSEEAPEEISSTPAEEAPAEISPPPSEEAPAEISPPQTEEAPVEISLPPSEEAPAEVSPPPAEEAPAEISPPQTEEAPVEISLPPSEETPAEVSPPPAEEAPAEVSPPPSEEVTAEISPQPAEEDIAEGVLSEEYLTREATAEAQFSLFEDAPIEAPVEVQLPTADMVPAEEAPEVQPLSLASTDEAPAEFEFPQTEETPLEGDPVEVQPLPAKEEVFTKVVPVEESLAGEIGSPSPEGAPTEETIMEAQMSSFKESLEKDSAEVQPLPPEITAEESPVKQPSETDVGLFQELPMQEIPAEAALLPSEQTPEDKAPGDEHQLSPVTSVLEKESESSTLTSDRNPEVTDPILPEVSKSKDEPISTFKIEGTIKIELKSSST
ncbi:fibrous sheath CABYR-binding protein [Sigmodon hispidus]